MFKNPNNYSIYTNVNSPIYTKDINANNYNEKYYDPLVNLMTDHIDDENVMMIKYKVIYEDDVEISLNVIDLFINLTMLRIPVMGNMIITSEYLIFDNVIENNMISDYIDNIIDKLVGNVDNKVINNIIADSIISFNIINRFSYYICNTISLFDIIDLKDRCSGVSEILSSDLKDTNFTNIKEESDNLTKKFKNDVIIDRQSTLYDYLSTSSGFPLKQLRECMINIGVKPDGLGGIFTVPIYNSFLKNGCNDPISYYTDASSARISQIIIKNNVGLSGYFSNMLSYNNIDTLLHSDPNYICDTKNYNRVTIENEKDLKLFRNRYYRHIGSHIEHCISSKDFHLIGQTIEMRTPMKCASYSRGYGVCHRCYGKLASVNKGLNIGKIAADCLSSKCTQPQLSSKHILEVKMLEYKWSEVFKRYFDFKEDTYMISVKPITSNAKLIIDPADIEIENNDNNEDDEFDNGGEIYNIKRLTIEDDGIYEFDIIPDNLSHLIMFSSIVDILDDHRIEDDDDDDLIIIPMSNLENMIIFAVPILNDDLINIINKSQKFILNKETIRNQLNICNSIDNLAVLFRKSVIDDAGLSINPLHLEVLMASQLYKTEECLDRVDWHLLNPEWTFVDLKHSLKNNPSVIVSLINGYLSHILNKPSTFIKENGSIFDPLYTPIMKDYFDKTL